MDQKNIIQALDELKAKSPQRKFSQMIDVTIKLRDLDIKKPEQKVDTFVTLPHTLGKEIKICAFVDGQLSEKARKVFPYVILREEFPAWTKDSKKQKKLAQACTYFVSQVEVMGVVASTFGKVLGPRGKMPNPKAGCVVPGAVPDLAPLKSKLERTIKLQTKNELAVKFSIGKQTSDAKHLLENFQTAYAALVKALPSGEDNIKTVLFKYSMGPSYELGKGLRGVA